MHIVSEQQHVGYFGHWRTVVLWKKGTGLMARYAATLSHKDGIPVEPSSGWCRTEQAAINEAKRNWGLR